MNLQNKGYFIVEVKAEKARNQCLLSLTESFYPITDKSYFQCHIIFSRNAHNFHKSKNAVTILVSSLYNCRLQGFLWTVREIMLLQQAMNPQTIV